MKLRPFLKDIETPLVMSYELEHPVREFRSMEDVRSYYWGAPKPDEQGQSRIAAFVTIGSLRGWSTCGDGPVCFAGWEKVSGKPPLTLKCRNLSTGRQATDEEIRDLFGFK